MTWTLEKMIGRNPHQESKAHHLVDDPPKKHYENATISTYLMEKRGELDLLRDEEGEPWVAYGFSPKAVGVPYQITLIRDIFSGRIRKNRVWVEVRADNKLHVYGTIVTRVPIKHDKRNKVHLIGFEPPPIEEGKVPEAFGETGGATLDDFDVCYNISRKFKPPVEDIRKCMAYVKERLLALPQELSREHPCFDFKRTGQIITTDIRNSLAEAMTNDGYSPIDIGEMETLLG